MADANPFQILTFIVAPAILTNSSSVLSLSTSNRFARTVDRSRFLYEKMKAPEKLTPQELILYQKQLPVIGRRSLLLVRALTWFYVSVGAFAATAFASILGAGISLFDNHFASEVTVIAALLAGSLGVIGLVTGTSMLVMEMWLALSFLQSEIELSEGIQINPIF
ncbi:MAG: hypothetical protein K0Q50_2578 [Vampirovibrio sp.]|jgi:hypothetical protein|nr:hypothetical protein [Vampirovibrio sp.]